MPYPSKEISPLPWRVVDFQGFGRDGTDPYDEAIIVDANGDYLWSAEPAEACGMSWADAAAIVKVVNWRLYVQQAER